MNLCFMGSTAQYINFTPHLPHTFSWAALLDASETPTGRGLPERYTVRGPVEIPTAIGEVCSRLALPAHAKVSNLYMYLRRSEATLKTETRNQSVNLVRATEVAHEFGISRVTLWRWERDGLLPRAHRINNQKYFPRTALDALKSAAAKPEGAKADQAFSIENRSRSR